MTVDGLLREAYDGATTAAAESSSSTLLLDAEITLHDVANSSAPKTVDEVWREIVSGDGHRKKECKEEAPDVMMTLEDFLLAKTGGADAVEEDEDVKNFPPPSLLTERLSGGIFAFDQIPPPSPLHALDKVEGSIVGFGNGIEVIGGGRTGKRGRSSVLEPLDKAAQQRQRRMIKNRESAARSRERKQAYQVELESLAVRLEEEREQLLKEKAERTKERFKQLMEKVIPIDEKRRPPRPLRRVHSFQW